MNTYNEIFLPIELNKALQNILSNVHHYYREHDYREHEKDIEEDIKEKRLREIYNPILNCPVLKDNIVWFNAWSRKHTKKSDIYFIKDCNGISKRIINVYREKGNEYDQYVSSLSSLAKYYGIKKDITGKNTNGLQFPFDYAYLITTNKRQECDIEMASEYTRDYFVYLNFEEISKLFSDVNFDTYYNAIETAFRKGEEDGYEKIIEILRENYYRLLNTNTNKIDVIVSELTDELSSSWQCSRKFGNDLNTLIKNEMIFDSNNEILKEEHHRENVIRLINYYFWVKLAFREREEEWKVLLYLPGVIAKEFGGIPLGVNIGLKEMVPLEIILFLERAVLLFFTRDSVDFFEEKAKKERDLVKKLNRLLTDFQHIMLKNILQSQYLLIRGIVEGKIELVKYIESLQDFLNIRKDFLANFAKYIIDGSKSGNKKPYNFRTILDQVHFINLPYFQCRNYGVVKSIENVINKWEKNTFIFSEINFNFNAYSGVMETFLENLIFNSVTIGFEGIDEGKIYLKGGNFSGINYFLYWDIGKGFEQSNFNNIKRWIGEGPSDNEGRTGLGYWLIARCIDYNEGDLKICAFDKTFNCYNDFGLEFVKEYFIATNREQLSLENLDDENFRVIHCFFETELKGE